MTAEDSSTEPAAGKERAKSIFVAGGRPFCIWVCGASMAYAGIVDPFMRFIAQVIFHYSGAFPAIDTTITLQVLFGLLGLGGMRSWDKARASK